MRNGRKKLLRVKNRIIVAMSTFDVLNSMALGLSIIPTPRYATSCSIGMGNRTTCTIQGFFFNLGFAVPSYNAMLCIYFVLMVRYRVSEATIARQIEPFMHTFAVGIPLITGIVAVIQGLFFSETSYCWTGDICQSLGNCPDGNIYGKGMWMVYIAMSLYVIVWATIAVCMIGTYLAVQKPSKAMARRNSLSNTVCAVDSTTRPTGVRMRWLRSTARGLGGSRSPDRGRDIAKQAYLYVAACGATYIWAWVSMVYIFIVGDPDELPIICRYLVSIFLPLQGFLNFFAFTRPKVVTIQRANRNISFGAALKKVIFASDSRTPEQRHRTAATRRNSYCRCG